MITLLQQAEEPLTLVKKPAEVKPPQTREDLHDIIVAGKKGRLGKLKLTGKLIVDSVRTGHMNLLKLYLNFARILTDSE